MNNLNPIYLIEALNIFKQRPGFFGQLKDAILGPSGVKGQISHKMARRLNNSEVGNVAKAMKNAGQESAKYGGPKTLRGDWKHAVGKDWKKVWNEKGKYSTDTLF